MESKCPKCGGEFEEGFVKGMTAYSGKEQWGKSVTWMGTVKNGLNVITYRCKKCGYLENYAK